MIKCVARPQKTDEPCLLSGNEGKPLLIKDEDDQLIRTIPAPDVGWDYGSLERECSSMPGLSNEMAYCAYLGEKQWVGSTEV